MSAISISVYSVYFLILGAGSYHWFRFVGLNYLDTRQVPSGWSCGAKAVLVTLATIIAGAGNGASGIDTFCSMLALGLLITPVFDAAVEPPAKGLLNQGVRFLQRKVTTAIIAKVSFSFIAILFFWASYHIWLPILVAILCYLHLGKMASLLLLAESQEGEFRALSEHQRQLAAKRIRRLGILGVVGMSLAILLAANLILPSSDITIWNYTAWSGVLGSKLLDLLIDAIADLRQG